MSEQGVDAAVERIVSDADFAAQCLANPEATLTSNFSLEPGEWRSIAWALQQDVAAAQPEVKGFATVALTKAQFASLTFQHLSQIPVFQARIDKAGGDPTVIPHAFGATSGGATSG